MNTAVTPGVGLVVLCTVMVVGAAVVYGIAGLGPVSVAPRAAVRGAAQLAAVALILAAALAQLWSSLLVLAVMFAAAAATSARRAGAGRSALWLAVALGAGLGVVLPILLLSGVVPLTGVALVPIGGIILGGTMTATSLSARRALDALNERWGEVEAALGLGFSDRAARLEIIRPTATDALLPGVDQTRTVGLVTLPGAFVGVLLATGSAAQAAAVQIMVLTGLLLAQSCAVAVTIELVARGSVHRAGYPARAPQGLALRSGSPTTSGDRRMSRMSIGCPRTG
ncbi:ABC transporter permease [Nocardia amamiensis]|uniref:ABC transporter permease n=1 Tax=Nocardia amamiensis TaxID=404578 RepID=UPI000A04631B|nr:ABC transporter permease [Nocardia amamiensis]